MNCIRCGNRAGYNRAVIDTLSGHELGGFCRNCEYDQFGRTLDRYAQSGRSCAMCNRDGHFVLPAWEPTMTAEGATLVSRVDYEVTECTPTLCDEHFHQIRDAVEEPPRRIR